MSSSASRRQQVVSDALSRVHKILASEAVTRQSLDTILDEVKQLATQSSLWNESDFPPPKPDEYQARYLIDQGDDLTVALYLNVMRPGKFGPPHDHTTWACIAGVAGDEYNTLYKRLDNGREPGKATLKTGEEILVGQGGGVALLADDIHSVRVDGDLPVRHLHLYGRALETLSQRTSFDFDAETCKTMDIGVKSRVAEGEGESMESNSD
jgi:predicted metal-dependent enzyme (double-stranded beta helix superfamily)